MPASRILPLARTSRWAMVGSGTRKACAISAVVSPPSSRSVRATWAAAASAGWQQVKIRRSRSSRTAPSSGGSSRGVQQGGLGVPVLAGRLPAEAVDRPVAGGGDDPSRRARRQPGGGQRCTAAVNASWTASSATSMSPKTRTRTATARPYSSRKTRSISEVERAGTPGISVRLGTAGPRSGGWSPGPAFRPHSSAASRSGALMMQKPPMCSLPSVYGPSVMSTSPSWTRTTVAVLGGCSPPAKTHAPAALISSLSASTSRMIARGPPAAGDRRRAGRC